MQQRIPGSQLYGKTRRMFHFINSACFQCGNKETKSGNGHGRGVQVNPIHSIQRLSHQLAFVGAGLSFLPQLQYSVKAAEQKMAGTAGGVDHADFGKAERIDGGCEGSVQDKCFDKIRCLQQGVFFSRSVGKILIQISKKSCIPVFICEIMNELSGFSIDFSEKFKKQCSAVACGRNPPDRVMFFVKKLAYPG